MNNSLKDHQYGNKRVCKLLEMVWTTKDGFESGKKFCPSPTTEDDPNCKVDVFAKRPLLIFKKSQSSTWHACRDLCNQKAGCEYFKWKVNVNDRIDNLFLKQLLSG